MDYCRDVCDKTIKFNSKSKHFKSLTHNDFETCVRMKHTNENPDFLIPRYTFNFIYISPFFIKG